MMIHCPKCRAILGERRGANIECRHHKRTVTIIGGTVVIECHKTGCGGKVIAAAGEAPTYAGMEKVCK